ncbi:Gluconate 2-dehydrogenase subunit 3 [Arboricoccus pini]|uniref:Gluconate 2-dehydrogenase subunit 3 n=1 Tax=Arboricoccus pini TaxID=1963835 RepID=A0A212RYD9_9PROT|nr:gluconate 2-dehydrogenase subunit 3 family protein [Arboricoccus pini]SNB77658.1 Gluconate 2-dehydrogenase subunit 3 [Arboricoccus pini]
MQQVDAASDAVMLADLVDVLIPSGDGWPSAAIVGVQGQLATRLIAEQGEAALPGLLKALRAAGAPFAGQADKQRDAIVSALERSEPELFAWVRDAVFIAYYESPFVAAAINAKGHPYKLRPHLTGYAVPRFDRTKDVPAQKRGHYVPTDQVRHVDISSLELESRVTTTWGRQR